MSEPARHRRPKLSGNGQSRGSEGISTLRILPSAVVMRLKSKVRIFNFVVMANPPIKWLSDLDKTVLMCNFEKRGWINGSVEGRFVSIMERCYNFFFFCIDADGDWNFYW